MSRAAKRCLNAGVGSAAGGTVRRTTARLSSVSVYVTAARAADDNPTSEATTIAAIRPRTTRVLLLMARTPVQKTLRNLFALTAAATRPTIAGQRSEERRVG